MITGLNMPKIGPKSRNKKHGEHFADQFNQNDARLKTRRWRRTNHLGLNIDSLFAGLFNRQRKEYPSGIYIHLDQLNIDHLAYL